MNLSVCARFGLVGFLLASIDVHATNYGLQGLPNVQLKAAGNVTAMVRRATAAW